MMQSVPEVFQSLQATLDVGPNISLVTEGVLARRLAVSRALLRKWRRLGQGPPFIRLGRCVRYPEQAAIQWVKAQASSN